MRTTFRVIHLFLLFCLFISAFAVLPAQSVYAAESTVKTEITSPEELLNPDGTLQLDGSFNGSLDLAGWDTQIDPAKGVVFSPKNSIPASGLAVPAVGDWGQVGDGAPAVNGPIRAIVISGSDIYIGGDFTNVAGIPEADYVAKWDGSAWSALGSDGGGNGAIKNFVHALAINGSGLLIVGGDFIDVAGIPEADKVAKWNGVAWSALGSNGAGNGAIADKVRAIAVSGNDVYVGGDFKNTAGIPEADHVAKWNGVVWSALGSSGAGLGAIGTNVFALVINGGDLYVGGAYTLVKWNGAAWSAVGGSALNGNISSTVFALAWNGGSLYVGGYFQDVAGIPEADYLVKWNGAAWSALGSNGSGNGALNGPVSSIAVSGSDFYAGGTFTGTVGIPAATELAKWNGTSWSAVGNPIFNYTVYAVAVNASGEVFAGGGFTAAAGLSGADYLAHWTGNEWKSLNNSVFNGAVRAVTVIGTDVYVGGNFTNAAGIPEADYIAKWNGSVWSAVGGSAGVGAFNNVVIALTTNGSDLYAGGAFTDTAGIAEADYIAKWNGTTWSALGSSAINNTVNALAMDASNNLYAGGNFLDAAAIPEADRVAKWNGSSWSTVGNINALTNGIVYAFAVHDNVLYVGGSFTDAAGIPEADKLVKWDGSAWSALGGSGGTGAFNNTIGALETNGIDVYAGGIFLNAAGIPEADRVAMWNGTSWSALGGTSALSAGVLDLELFGNDLYIAGQFLDAGSNPEADYITRWDGSTWNALGNAGPAIGSLSGIVASVKTVNNQLFIGGYFTDPSNNGQTLTKADYFAAYGITDTAPPQVQSIVRTEPNPASTATVKFTVTFTEDVTGVENSDFSLFTTGVIGASITVTSGSNKVYTVTVNTGSGNGTIRLDVPNTATITDLASNPLGGLPYSTGEVYTITGAFNTISKWTSALDLSHGWTVNDFVRTVGDVNGDGKADLVGFGLDGVYVALSNGSSFESAATKWTSAMDLSHGWTVQDFVRTVGDVNGDGKADLVGFGLDGVYVALSNGSSFESAATKWTSAMDLSHGWTVQDFVRTVGDVNGDGKADIVGFGLDGVYVALSNGTSFAPAATKWTSALDLSHGWTVKDYVRTVGDVDGDGDADLVGFGLDGIYVSLSNGSSFAPTATKWTSALDFSHGWTVKDFVRIVGDVNGDGKMDLVGFGLDGVYVALSNGTSFEPTAIKWTNSFDLSHGWTVTDFVRTVGDVNKDGKADLVGFGLDGVYIGIAK